MTLFSDLFRLTGTGTVTITGAGGKTTLMFRLARELVSQNRIVLTTTTTKIFMPGPIESSSVILSESWEDIARNAGKALKTNRHVTAAQRLIPEKGKLLGLTPDQVDCLHGTGMFDWILVEGDGARQKPLKACADHEPVIPPCSDHGILVSGLDALGGPLNEQTVFRPELVSSVTGVPPNSPVTPECMGSVLCREIRRLYAIHPFDTISVFLNKADTDTSRKLAARVAQYITEADLPHRIRIIAGSLHHDHAAVIP